jgi:hypothetical protein
MPHDGVPSGRNGCFLICMTKVLYDKSYAIDRYSFDLDVCKTRLSHRDGIHSEEPRIPSSFWNHGQTGDVTIVTIS